MADRLVQGQPLTYEYLADIEKQVDTLSGRIATLFRNINLRTAIQDITVLVDNMKRGTRNANEPNNVQVLAGAYKIAFTGNPRPVVFQTVRFDRAFKAEPIVVATVADQGDTGARGANVAFATVTIGEVSHTQFNFKVEMIRQGTNITRGDLQLNYIAIGAGE